LTDINYVSMYACVFIIICSDVKNIHKVIGNQIKVLLAENSIAITQEM
jgi:hypothetical protein